MLPNATIRETSHGKIEIVADAAALAAALADTFTTFAAEAISARGICSVALAGGSTPRAAYALLAAAPRREAVAWQHIQFFFGDERCVPPTSDQSNYRMAHETLISQIGLDSAQVHRMRGEDDPLQAAEAYAKEMTSVLGPDPVFDIVLLGLGPDAHTASWFPGVVIPDDVTVAAPYVPKFASHRLTLTPSVINTARRIVVATAGSEKAEALGHVFSAERNESTYPAQRLAPVAGTLTWLVDRAAAEGIR